MKKILVLSNSSSGLVSFRIELLDALIKNGFEVYVSVPYDKKCSILEEIGCIIIKTYISRHGKNPFEDLKLKKYYKKMIKEIKPSCVLSYTIKPNVYGGIVCKKLNVPYIVNITGLGSAIENKGLLQKISLYLYKKSLLKANHVFFQNEYNCNFMLKKGIVKNNYSIIPGSGVNLSKHTFKKYPINNVITFVTVGRIMKDKGIYELLNAARIIKEKYNNVLFLLIGSYDDDMKDIISEYEKDNIIKHIDFTLDVDSYYEKCNAIIHPSYHEGMSNVLLEAAACGRPIIASNIPGCREIFENNTSGIAFEPKNVDSLVCAIDKFINLDDSSRADMGLSARRKVEKEFDRQIIVNSYFDEIKKIMEE